MTITLDASDPSTADQAAGFVYKIDWEGNGSVDQTVNGTDGTTVSHVFTVGGSTNVIVTATDKDGGQSEPTSLIIEVIQPVELDLKSGNSQNRVNAKSQGVIPVVLYVTTEFDVSTIDTPTIRLAGIEAVSMSLEDVDDDGDLDLILHFATQDLLDALTLELSPGDEESVELELTGVTGDDVLIHGFDTVNFFFPGKGKGKK